MKEIYWNADNTSLLIEDKTSNRVITLSELSISEQVRIDAAIKATYPTTYQLLSDEFGKGNANVKGRVRQFVACNLSFKDGKTDIDDDYNITIENVSCPARYTKQCLKEYCQPQITSILSNREIEILRFIVSGKSNQEIAEALFISGATVHNHITNMYQKTGATNSTAPSRKLIAYAIDKGLI